MNEQNTALQSSMVLHCGAAAATLDDVYAVETPDVPEVEFVVKTEDPILGKGRRIAKRRQLAGPFADEADAVEAANSIRMGADPVSCIVTSRRPRFEPIPHARLVEEVQKTSEAAGLKIVDQAHALTKDGRRYFGLLQVANGNNPEDFGVIYGLRNAHDFAFKASVGLGSRVFICDNLAFSFEVDVARMHTKNILRDLPGLVSQAVGKLGENRAAQEARFSAYKDYKLDDANLHDLSIRALDARAFPVTKLPKVLAEVREPSHEEFLESGRTAWTFFNAVTEVLKGGNVQELPKRTLALQGVLDVTTGTILN